MLIFLALSLVQIINMLTTFFYLMGVGSGCKVEAMLLRLAIHGPRCWDAPTLEIWDAPTLEMYRFLQCNRCEDNQDLWDQYLHS